MWSVRALLLGIRAVSGRAHDVPVCREHGYCRSCVQAPSWWSNCRWCPLDNECHETGSTWNTCTVDQNIHDEAHCPVDPSPSTGFDLQVATDMLLYAQAAYLDNPQKGLLPVSFYVNSTFTYQLIHASWNDAFGYLGVDHAKQRVVLAYRGTDSRSTTKLWLQLIDEALNSEMVPYPGLDGVEVNHYFLAAVAVLAKSVYGKLGALLGDNPRYSLWITGHSLGGAMASISAFDLINLGKMKEPLVYTFGQPRTGNFAFAHHFALKVPHAFRIVNNADFVPHVPACDADPDTHKCTGNGYYHAGTEIWFPAGDYEGGTLCNFRECMASPQFEDFTCSDGLIAFYDTPNLADHSGYWDVNLKGFCGKGAASESDVEPGAALII